MKRLNKKGFTLVELLAVIVILAIVVGIALVTVLPTLENSRVKSFDIAVDAIKTYIQEQRDMSLLSSDLRGDSYNATVGETECTSTSKCSGTIGDTKILEITGYDKNISAIRWYVSGGIVVIDCATANSDGDYRQSETYSACS